MRSFLEEEDVLYADLPGKRTSENPTSTVPVSILATSARPDMVLIRSMEITLIELTVPFESRENLNNARARKSQKSSYLELLGDLEAKGYSASLVTCEISSLGHSLPVCHPRTLSISPSLLHPCHVQCCDKNRHLYLLLDIHGPQRSSLAIRETFIHLTALCVHHCDVFPLYSHFNVHSFYNFYPCQALSLPFGRQLEA